MNTVWAASPPQTCVLFDTDEDWHTQAGHSVERVAGDFGFGLLIGQSPGMKTPADDGLVAIHRRLHEAPPAIPTATLPSDAAVVLDRTQMVIALRRADLTECLSERICLVFNGLWVVPCRATSGKHASFQTIPSPIVR
jgi:hypothetical protein